MYRHIAVGDIHGCINTLRSLLDNIINIDNTDTLYLLGDLIDRGPSSMQVLDYVMELKKNSYDIRYIRGNHELMMLEALQNESEYSAWLHNGGTETLNSFTLGHISLIPRKYIDLIQSSIYYEQALNCVLVHGGLNFEIPYPLQDTLSMPWIRNQSIDVTKIGHKRLIVGHTPVSLLRSRRSIQTSHIKLDTGCVYQGRFFGIGYLTAFDIANNIFFTAKNIEIDSKPAVNQ